MKLPTHESAQDKIGTITVGRAQYGGYIVQQSYSSGNYPAMFGAFSTLGEALEWIRRNLQ